MPCKTLAILLSGLIYKKDNGYLCGIIGVSRAFHPNTQLIDALIESWAALFNHLGRLIEDLGRNRDALLLCRLEVDDQIKL